MIIKRIDPGSCAKIMGVIDAAIGLIIGLLMALLSLVGGAALGGGLMSGFGIAAIIVLPILYGFFGLIAGFLVAVIYNWAAGRVGGLQVEAE